MSQTEYMEVTEAARDTYTKITMVSKANGSTIVSIHEKGNMFPSKINLSPNSCKTLGKWLIERAEELGD